MAEKDQDLSSSDSQSKGENKKQEDAEDAKPKVTESPGGKKLPKKTPTKSPAKPTKSKAKKKEPSDDDSDDEELVGILDKPLVIEGKRDRKSTDFLMNSIKTPISVEKKKVDVPQGKGETLGSMPRVQFQLNRIVADELKPLHKVLFGRPGVNSEVKKNIRCFNGYDFEKDSKEYSKKLELIERFTSDSLRRLCEILDVDKKGMKKEEIPMLIMVFLMNPKASGKAMPDLKKKSHKRKQSETKTTSKKEEKDSSKEEAEDESGSGNEEEEEEKEEKEKPAPKKDKKSTADEEKKEKKEKKKRKRETKTPTKKEKKVFAVKIAPGKKSKKAKKDDPVVSSDDEPLIKKAKKSPPTDDEIVDLVKELLDGADLEKITMKSVCRQVYDRFPDFDLTDRKEFIKDTVKDIIT